MPCIQCPNGAEICGPGVSQGDCSVFDGIEALEAPDKGDPKCPEGWCFERMCEEGGKKWSVWRPTSGSCLRWAYTPYRGWHEQKCGC